MIAHPAAITHLGRPHGTKWFTCKNDADETERLARSAKAQWEAELAILADRHKKAVIFLCADKSCSGKITIDRIVHDCLHIFKWRLIKQGGFGDNAIKALESSSKRGVSAIGAQFVKDRGKKPHSEHP